MLDLIKKHKVKAVLILLLTIFDLVVITLSIVRTDKDVTTPGGLNEVEALIKIDNDFEYSGSFNTIYVYSVEHSSVLQTYIASLANYNEISDSSTDIDLTDKELRESGKIQKEQSIEASLICAYNYANKNFDENINISYEFKGFIVYYYQKEQKNFEIGDIINKVLIKETNEVVDLAEPEKLANAINNIKIGDTIYFLRGNKELSYVLDENLSSSNLNRFAAYAKFAIDEEKTFPKYNLYSANTLGPSGGLLQTLSVYSQITGIDLTKGKKICGTGTISVGGTVGRIGGISQKIVTAIRNDADVFLCPSEHYEEAMETYYKTKGHEKMTVIEVSTFEDAVNALMDLGEKNDY